LNGITYIIIVLVKCRCYLERELRHTDTANGVGGQVLSLEIQKHQHYPSLWNTKMRQLI